MQLEKYQRLWGLTEGQRLRYAGAILAMAVSNAFLFGAPLVVKAAIDGILGGSQEQGELTRRFVSIVEAHGLWIGLGVAAGLIVLLTVFSGGFQYLRGRWASLASEAIVRRVRNQVFAHLERLPAHYHDRADTGDLVQRCTSDVETVRVFLALQVVEIGRAILLLAMVVPVMLALSVPLTLVALALFPIIIVFAIGFFKRVQSLFLRVDESEGEMTAVLQENLTGIRVVRAFARQDYERGKFAGKNGGFRDLSRRLIDVLAVYWGISDFLCIAQIGLCLFLGAMWAQSGEITVGTLYAFLSYEAIVMWPVRHMGRVLTDTGKAIVALGRLREILDEPEEDDGETSGAKLELEGAIEFKDLTFRYSGEDSEVLKSISFAAAPGETVALLGPPGSGKSTIVQLLLRLYEYEEGSIRLDGRELSTLDRRAIRSQIGAVLQEPFLYSTTLEANVRVGRENASSADIVEAANAASVHESIETFESGYDTLIGERGVTLSGGQRQRVAIARALIRDPKILILDDALSAVDTGTESRILGALESRRGRSTTIVIAHRLSSIQHADQILVLDEGEIVERGNHDELIQQDGAYARLWTIQGALEDEIETDLAS